MKPIQSIWVTEWTTNGIIKKAKYPIECFALYANSELRTEHLGNVKIVLKKQIYAMKIKANVNYAEINCNMVLPLLPPCWFVHHQEQSTTAG